MANRPLGIVCDNEALETSRGRVTKKYLLEKYGAKYTQEFWDNVTPVLRKALERTYVLNPEAKKTKEYQDILRNSSTFFAKMSDVELEKTVDDMSFHLNQVKKGLRLDTREAQELYEFGRENLPNLFYYDTPLTPNVCSEPPEHVGYEDLTSIFV